MTRPARRLASRAIASLAFLALALLAQEAGAQALRCGGLLVTEGEDIAAVAHACGAPDFRDPWIAGNGFGPAMTEWTYNAGPQQLIRIVLFRGNRVAATGNGGYGFTIRGGFPPSGACEPTDIQPGLSKYRLLSACGPPVRQRGGFIVSNRIVEPGYRVYLDRSTGPFVYREHWTYNFGDRRLIRYVTLENARVVDVELGPRGFNR